VISICIGLVKNMPQLTLLWPCQGGPGPRQARYISDQCFKFGPFDKAGQVEVVSLEQPQEVETGLQMKAIRLLHLG